MSTSVFKIHECCICLNPYDSGVHKAVVRDCGHTLCKECNVVCLYLGRWCPTCKAYPLTDAAPNYIFIEALNEIESLRKAVTTLKKKREELITPDEHHSILDQLSAKNAA